MPLAPVTHFGLDLKLRTVEHGHVSLDEALAVARDTLARRRDHYRSGEEGLSDASYGFSRAEDYFIEVVVRSAEDFGLTVELPLQSGWWVFKSGFRHERDLHSQQEVEEWIRQFFLRSPHELHEALTARRAV